MSTVAASSPVAPPSRRSGALGAPPASAQGQVDRHGALPEGADLAPGYEVVGLLSRRRAVDVYDVWSVERDCRCVAKVLRPECRDDRRAAARLLREGTLLQGLTHPHIVRAYEVHREPEPMVVLETVGGETLAHLISRPRRLPLTDLALLGVDLASALTYLHRNGHLHLDMKPSNAVIESGRAKLLDLSVARAPGRAPRGVGTRQYMSPEQARGGVLGPEADVWGLGAVLYEAATGTRPFRALEGHRYEQLERRATPVASRWRASAAFFDLVDSCLEPDPQRRPTLEQAAEVLDALLGEDG